MNEEFERFVAELQRVPLADWKGAMVAWQDFEAKTLEKSSGLVEALDELAGLAREYAGRRAAVVSEEADRG